MLHVPISMLVYWRVTISNHRKWGFFHRFNLIWAINYYLRLVFLLVAPQDELCGWITCEKSHSWTPHTQASKMLIFNQTWWKSEAQISFVSRIFPLNILKCPVFFFDFPWSRRDVWGMEGPQCMHLYKGTDLGKSLGFTTTKPEMAVICLWLFLWGYHSMNGVTSWLIPCISGHNSGEGSY